MKRLVLLFVLVVVLVGCGAKQKDAANLAESIRNYNDGIRWSRYAMAASSIPPTERGAWVDEMDAREKDLRITDMEIVRVEPKGERAANVQVKVSWYKDTEGTLHETHEMQQWERHGKEWWRVESTLFRGESMPGLTEKLEVADEKTSEPAE